jgi:adenylate kinase family enzyme
MVFGQVVIGPSGSGKTTYCNGMSQFLSFIGRCETFSVTSNCSSRATQLKWNVLALCLVI